jgi:hypothetical protein
MGSLSDIFLLTAYAIEIDNGSVDGNQYIALDEINRFLLPEVHNSIHNDAITFAEQNGWIDDGTISTDHALTLLSYFNDPALADYLWWNLQPYDWESFKQNFELDVTEMPLPYSGLYLSISETITDDSIDSMIDQWGNQRVEYRSYVIELSDQFVNSENLRTEWSDELQNNRLGRCFMEERDALALFPRTTASEAVTFLKNLRNSDMISEDSAERVLNWMRAPYQDLSEITRDFTDYGALFDNRMGLLNGFDFGTLVYTGDTKVQAIFFDRLPIGFWFHMSGTQMHQDFQQRLIYDPALIDLMEKVSLRASQNEINNDVQLN